MIQVRKAAGSAYEVVNGRHRLTAQLDLSGTAEVVDVDTHETFVVHEVDGELRAVVVIDYPGITHKQPKSQGGLADIGLQSGAN